MWRIWFLFDPRTALIGLVMFLAVMALLIHFILLSTDRYNWLQNPGSGSMGTSSVIELVEPPVSRIS